MLYLWDEQKEDSFPKNKKPPVLWTFQRTGGFIRLTLFRRCRWRGRLLDSRWEWDIYRRLAHRGLRRTVALVGHFDALRPTGRFQCDVQDIANGLCEDESNTLAQFRRNILFQILPVSVRQDDGSD